jgi:crossover junction endodeoxyribonuclease RuvC
MRILGIDPGLRQTGWGVIDNQQGELCYIACGVIIPSVKEAFCNRLAWIYRELDAVLDTYQPTATSVEETFVNQNPTSALKLGMARGVILVVPALRKIPLFEYSANHIKKCVVGAGHAQKHQVEAMIRILLPKSTPQYLDPNAADALAAAVCHAHSLKLHTIEQEARNALQPKGLRKVSFS